MRRLIVAAATGHRMAMSRLWADTLAIPRSIDATLAERDGFGAVETLLRDEATRRVVLSGNGAAWYVALAVSLALLESSRTPSPVVAVPAGLVAAGAFRWQPGDVLLAVSTSGELRDLVELLDAPAPAARPERVALVTASPESTLARHAGAVALTKLADPAAFTHSQAYAANLVTVLSILAAWSGDDELAAVARSAAAAAAASIEESDGWPESTAWPAAGSAPPRMATVFGSGAGWAAALEAALLLREVARIPAEGTETREAATSSMFSLGEPDLVVSLRGRDDPLADEAADVSRSMGARVLTAPGCATGDRRLAPILAFPASVRLAIDLAALQGLDPDAPATAAAYYRTARRR
jgi:glutamine---fructose-6-phosphate transaminase (isomerizing)